MRRARLNRSNPRRNGKRASFRRRSRSRCEQGRTEDRIRERKHAMNDPETHAVEEQLVRVPAGPATLEGNLTLPEEARAVVLFAHGSGSSRHSPRNRYVARVLNEAKLATLLIDLLTVNEELIDMRTAQLRFDIELLAERLVGATNWVAQFPDARQLRIGYFGASPGAAAALVAAAVRPDGVGAIVSRGGRPDLAGAGRPPPAGPPPAPSGENRT